MHLRTLERRVWGRRAAESGRIPTRYVPGVSEFRRDSDGGIAALDLQGDTLAFLGSAEGAEEAVITDNK
jgi:hypothetical protein